MEQGWKLTIQCKSNHVLTVADGSAKMALVEPVSMAHRCAVMKKIVCLALTLTLFETRQPFIRIGFTDNEG